MRTQRLTYVLITPARNEAQLIEQTIRSVVSQAVLPRKWVIASDGSSDGTDEIIVKYAALHPWIELARMPDRKDRHFAGKVQCVNQAYERLRGEEFDVVANLDADITFDRDYFAFLLDKLAADPLLGVTGTPFVEGTTSYDFRFTAVEHVSGACQVFRRECFEQIGGYMQVKGGGIDWIAVTTARMKGWKTRTFVERVCYHHRPMGTASTGKLRANFKLGAQDYYLGGHALWQLFRSCYQMTRKPYLVGGLLLVAGYCWAWVSGVQRPVPPELIRFHQHEQMQRLFRSLSKIVRVRTTAQAGS
ncbi:MAG TPA: glycosyltransferase family 2 protein [Candidatus Angelobacter sp.]|nr:glycosyltransferase family 2 protein [Candidatus Angelobacter sp.]